MVTTELSGNHPKRRWGIAQVLARQTQKRLVIFKDPKPPVNISGDRTFWPWNPNIMRTMPRAWKLADVPSMCSKFVVHCLHLCSKMVIHVVMSLSAQRENFSTGSGTLLLRLQGFHRLRRHGFRVICHWAKEPRTAVADVGIWMWDDVGVSRCHCFPKSGYPKTPNHGFPHQNTTQALWFCPSCMYSCPVGVAGCLPSTNSGEMLGLAWGKFVNSFPHRPVTETHSLFERMK